jgi:hypothetical protein
MLSTDGKYSSLSLSLSLSSSSYPSPGTQVSIWPDFVSRSEGPMGDEVNGCIGSDGASGLVMVAPATPGLDVV